MFQVSDDVFAIHPDYLVGCVYARGIDNTKSYGAISHLRQDAAEQARRMFENQDLKNVTLISIWRQRFATSGWSGSEYPSSVEALLKRVRRGYDPPHINPIVDLSIAATLMFAVPIGAHDVQTFTAGRLTVRRAVDTDCFHPMGSEGTVVPTPGEIVYSSGSDVRTRRWVWRQSASALIDPTTTDVFFPIDGFSSITASNVQAATEFIADASVRVFGADVVTGRVTADSPLFPKP